MGSGMGGTPPKTFSPPEEAPLIKVEGRVEELAGQQAEQNRETREYQKRQIRYNRWLTAFTGLLFLTSAVANLVGYFQLRQAQRSADAATVAAGAAKKAADAAAQSAQADAATVKAAVDSVATSRDNLRFSQEAFRLDQRAWISMESILLTEPLKPGGPVAVVIRIKNTGKTPALQVATVDNMGFVKPALPEIQSPHRDAGSTELSGPLPVAPGAEHGYFSASRGINQVEMDQIIGSKSILYVYGRTEYRDIFQNVTRHTYFCMFYAADGHPPGFRYCSEGNSMD